MTSFYLMECKHMPHMSYPSIRLNILNMVRLSSYYSSALSRILCPRYWIFLEPRLQNEKIQKNQTECLMLKATKILEELYQQNLTNTYSHTFPLRINTQNPYQQELLLQLKNHLPNPYLPVFLQTSPSNKMR